MLIRTKSGPWALWAVVILVVVVAWPTGALGKDDDVSSKFVGHWRLVSMVNFAEDGTVSKRNMSGRIMYDGHGNMSAQLMPTQDVEMVENNRTRGYMAYYGEYEIDTEKGTVTHRPEGTNIFRWLGGDLVRYYDFVDGKLTLSLKSDGRTTGTLTWERIE